MSAQFSASDWRGQTVETFQVIQETDLVLNTTADGTLVSTEEILYAWASAPSDSASGYLYADGKRYKDPVFKFQATQKTTTSYAASGPNSYVVTVTTLDLLTGKVTTQPSTVVDGAVPQAPRRGSAYSRIYTQPVVVQVTDPCVSDHFADSSESVDISRAESDDQANAMLSWEMKTKSAIQRLLDTAYNPLMLEGDTVLLDIPSRGISGNHLLWGITGQGDETTGKFSTTLDLRYFTR